VNRFRQRVTDVLGLDAHTFVELFFKRQDHQHSVDVTAQGPNPISSPGPNLGTDVVNDFEAFTMKGFREPHIEVRPINQDNRGRTSRAGGIEQSSIGAVQLTHCASYFEHAHDPDFASVYQRIDSYCSHLVTSGSEQIEAGVGKKLLEGFCERGAVFVATSFTGDYHYR